MKKVLMILAIVLMATFAQAGEKEELLLKKSNCELFMQNIQMQMQLLPIKFQEAQKEYKEIQAKLEEIQKAEEMKK